MKPVIITAAICGAEATREDNPALPLTPTELAAEARASQDAGASVIHLHVRDAKGKPTQDKEVFRQAMCLMEDAGVTAIIQPGGSKGDEDAIKAANERDIAMVFTGMRHFKH